MIENLRKFLDRTGKPDLWLAITAGVIAWFTIALVRAISEVVRLAM